MGDEQSSVYQLNSHSHFPVATLHFPLLLQCESYLQTNSENIKTSFIILKIRAHSCIELKFDNLLG